VNPNNHALDGGPGTSALEVEVVEKLAAMFGLRPPSLGHLTSSGTIANLEALWVARELRPGARVVHSADAHYTHGRTCQVPGVGRLYKHDSPYTYFTSGELHLGEISLECSRAGAAAAALWLTLEAFPLVAGDGLGAMLAAGRRAALRWAELLAESDVLELHL